VAGLRTAARRQLAVVVSVLVRPDDEAAAVAVRARIGIQRDTRTDVGSGGVEHIRIRALIVAANQRGAATGSAGDIDHCIADQADAIAEYRDRAARARRIAGRRIERTARLHDAVRTEQTNRAP